MKRLREPIEYEPIPEVSGSGHIALTIRPPGTWFDSVDFVVFVGGCGVGHAKTLRAAEELLLQHARAECDRRTHEAQCRLNHFTEQRRRLSAGLVRLDDQ